jgi:hypothetical protein
MVRVKNHYDWVVLGNHPAALLSAVLVARMGLSVLVVSSKTSVGLSVSPSGLYFDSEPNTLVGLKKTELGNGPLLDCLSRLGLLSGSDDPLQAFSPQIVTPSVRFTAVQDERFQAELQRELGPQISQQIELLSAIRSTEAEYFNYWSDFLKNPKFDLDKFYRLISRKLLSSGSSLSDWASSRLRSSDLGNTLGRSDLAEVFEGLWFGVNGNVNVDPALLEVLICFHLSKMTGSFRGGLTRYREFLMEDAKKYGVHFATETELRRVFIENGKFAGIQIENVNHVIRAESGILGRALSRIYKLITLTGSKKFELKRSMVTPSGWRFTVALTVHKEAVPPVMQSPVIWQEKGAPVLEIETAHPQDYQLPDNQHKILYLRTVLPFSVETLNPKYQRLIAGRMVKQVLKIIPFLEFHVVNIYPDFRLGSVLGSLFGKGQEPADETALSQTDLSKTYDFVSLDEIPDHLLIPSQESIGSESGIEGLYVASDESYPKLGSLGATVAALEAVSEVGKKYGFSSVFR